MAYEALGRGWSSVDPWESLWLKKVIQMVGRGPGEMKFGKSRGVSVQKREKVKRIRFCRKSNKMRSCSSKIRENNL